VEGDEELACSQFTSVERLLHDTLTSVSQDVLVDVSYAAPQAYEIVNIALHRRYSLGIIFIFSQGRKYLYHV
jgi:hypothetical protein